ncbi:hypothetical protein [Streptomyces sp. AS02]|uniref:hypothetical protein n=1 Tax=Streptomyces sp. AS02 TaxID=2938946 RepID=UPI002020CB15|nr:hypothetical protein [Streptomyces sp. AS02]MCL8015759.1 hypothetical protein [Streptomyces sp. AS02]
MATAKRAAMTVEVLTMLAHYDPRLWELVHPHVPPHPVHDGFRGVRSANFTDGGLNPQPIPPGNALLPAVRDMSVAVAEATIAASLAGRKPAEIAREIGDDICPEPPKVPWPKKWPVPVQLREQLISDPQRVSPAVQATAALVFQSYAHRTTDKPLSTAFADLADRLLERALKTSGRTA